MFLVLLKFSENKAKAVTFWKVTINGLRVVSMRVYSF
jgi:hypothetical protein